MNELDIGYAAPILAVAIGSAAILIVLLIWIVRQK